MKATLTDSAMAALPAEAEPVLIVLGRDEASKPHASKFGAAEAELAIKAAGMMGMRVLPITTDENRAAALQVAAGRIFDSGRGSCRSSR